MDHGCVSPGAVELPPRKLEPQLGRRRHRRITGASGLLLFICLFLPAVKGCNDQPIYAIELPMFIHPYLFGIVFSAAAAAFTLRGLRHTIIALRTLVWLTIAGACVIALMEPGSGLIELVLGFGLLAAIGRHGYSEKRAAICSIVVGTAGILWFGFWSATSDALIGVYLSTLASGGLLAGGLVWLAETAYDSAHGWKQPMALPGARGNLGSFFRL